MRYFRAALFLCLCNFIVLTPSHGGDGISRRESVVVAALGCAFWAENFIGSGKATEAASTEPPLRELIEIDPQRHNVEELAIHGVTAAIADNIFGQVQGTPSVKLRRNWVDRTNNILWKTVQAARLKALRAQESEFEIDAEIQYRFGFETYAVSPSFKVEFLDRNDPRRVGGRDIKSIALVSERSELKWERK